METHSYADMEALQASNWWYVARRELIRRLIAQTGRPIRRVLDLGCGVGSNSAALAGDGRYLIGTDASSDALERSHALGRYAELIRAEAEVLPVADASLDLVVCADVLEHIDDARALAEIRRVLKPDGLLIITVPAHAWLWNWNDDYSHHLRRYSKKMLREVIAAQGFRIRKLTFWNATFTLPVLAVSLLQRLRAKPERLENNLNSLPAWMNRLLLAFMRVENFIVTRARLPIGVSLVAVAEPAPVPQLEHQERP